MANMYIKFGSFFVIMGLLGISYGYFIKNKKTCVICGKETPCQFNSCKPVGIEGNILHHIFKWM